MSTYIKIRDVKFLPAWCIFRFKIILLLLALITINAITIVYFSTCSAIVKDNNLVLWVSNFENFNNRLGSKELLVPNIVHFLRFDQPEISFTDTICILSALKNHGPDYIYIHSNSKNFTGKYWNHLLNISEFQSVYRIKPISLPITIFGQNFSEDWHKEHASDITRMRILMQYGGIFLDNDSFVVKNLTKYRYYEMSLGWDENEYFGTQVLIAHPDARFLKLWLESYRNNYNSTLWYFNAGEWPTMSILEQKYGLINRVQKKFGIDTDIIEVLYKMFSDEWRECDAIHLLINHRYYLDKDNYELYETFDDKNILNCNVSFCTMAREVYFSS